MERVEKGASEGSATDRPRRRLKSDTQSATASVGMIRVLLVLTLVLIVAVAAVVIQMTRLRDATQRQFNVIAVNHKQTDAIAGEVHQLRQFVTSKTSEEVIYLKMSILKPDLDPAVAGRIARLVHHYAGIYNQDTDLILAIMFIESQFDPAAQSNKGAMGLMQVMPQWQKVLGMSGDLNDPEISLKYGLQILGFYQEMYKDNEMALTAYNRGPGPVDMALMNGRDYKNGYAAKVLGVYERLRAMNIGED